MSGSLVGRVDTDVSAPRVHIFQKSRSRLKILGAQSETWS